MQLNKVKRVTSALLGELPLKENGATFKPAAFKRETQRPRWPRTSASSKLLSMPSW